MFFHRDHVRKGDQYYRKGNLQQAAYHYLKAKRVRQAAKIYEELGRIDRAVELYESEGHHLEAAEILEAHGQLKRASSFFEKGGAFQKAAEASLKLRNHVRAGRLFERAGMYSRAADCFHKGNDLANVVRVLEVESRELRAERRDHTDLALEKNLRKVDARRAEVLAKVGSNLEAAQLFDEHGAAERAAPLYDLAGRFADAARAWLAAGRFEEALRALDRISGSEKADDELRAEIYLNCARHAQAAKLFESMGRYDAAASAHADAGDWASAGRLWEKAGASGRAADAFRQAGMQRRAADSYRQAGRTLEAGERYLEAGEEDAAREVFQSISEDSAEYVSASLRLIPLLVDAGEVAGAAHRWQVLQERGDPIPARDKLYVEGRLCESQGRFREAEILYQRVLAEEQDFQDVAARLRNLRGKLTVPAEALGSEETSRARRTPSAAPDTGELLRLSAIELSQEELELLSTTDPLVPPDPPTGEEPADEQPVGEEPAGEESTAAEPAGEEPAEEEPAGEVRAEEEPAEEEPAGEEPAGEQPVEQPVPIAAAETAPALSISSLATASDLPFDIGEELEPWWQGAAFFRARDRRKGCDVFLVSFPLAVIGGRPESFRKAMREITAIRHPTILRLEDAILASDKVLLLYEPFSEQTLGSRLAERNLAPAAALSLVAQLCEALAAAHKLGVTHQWVSPRTVLMDDQGNLRLVGLGLREILAYRDQTSLAYLSPEVRDEGVIGPASDVYSLGLLAVELLRAEMPPGWAERAALDAADIGWPADVEEAVAPSVREVLVRALAREPLARPSTEELKQVLLTLGLAPGQVLAQRYRIVSELGRGGMSRVYRALDQELDDEVAIKTLLAPTVGVTEEEERLLREVRLCRKISHPNVVRVHDIGRFPGGIFVIMEILEGQSLDRVIEAEAPLALARTRKILGETAAALAEAHRNKIVHRDLKPSNIMLVGERVKVVDFGIARMADGSTVQLTKTGQVIGSPMYMAPEQIQGLPLSGTCDLYALGVIAFTLLTGREPFTGETTTAIALKHLHEAPPDIRELRPDLPPPWTELLDRLLAKKPEDRPQRAEEVIAALADLPE